MYVQKDPLVLTSLEDPKKIQIRSCLTLEVYSSIIDYENGKRKSAYYLVQLVDCDDLNDQ